ncbi:MAG: 4-hydroxy-tetrahydrodipicolinate synthase [Hyphomicrobiaceae bacterium]|nr:MAG: 4-hydroxy-tetrahydrodipicolinate synthase [Hyphomicrobiaceae bacterium]
MTLKRTMIHGILPALTTPLDAKGHVDAKAVAKQVDYVIAGGASGLVPVGGTGEYTALTPKERVAMVELTVAAARRRVPVIAGVLSPGLGEAIEAGRAFLQAGADGLMVIAPFYITPTQKGIRDYFKACADAVGGPVMLYEIPYRTGVALKAETIAEIAGDGSIVGMKASNPDMAQLTRVLALCGETINVASGEEMLFPTAIALGAVGGVLATADILPRSWMQIFDLARNGNLKAALAKHAALAPFLAAVFAECNPGPLKAAQGIAGIQVGPVLCPLRPPAAALVKEMEALLQPLLAAERALAKEAA